MSELPSQAGVPQDINNTVIIISKHKLSLWGNEEKKAKGMENLQAGPGE